MEQKTILRETKITNSIIFKLPEQQDPVIAICFKNKEEAQQHNADLIEKFKRDRYSLNVWTIKSYSKLLNVMLISDQNQRLYKDLEFNSGQFKWWLQFTEQTKQELKFRFYHLYLKDNKPQLVNTQFTNTPFVLTLHRFNIKDKENLIL